MKISVYLQGLRTTHYICVVQDEDGRVLAVLSVPKVHASYSDARSVFKTAVRSMRDTAEPLPFTVSYYR